MAGNLAKVTLFRTIGARGYATAVPLGGTTNYDVKTTVLPSKLVVAAAENECPISRVSVVFRAGSRQETPDNLGTAHVLRICAGLSTANASQFAIIRNVQEVGASLSVTSDRELIAYTLEGTRDAVEKTLPFLTEVTTNQIFKPWEVADNEHRLRLELATRPPQQRAIDLLHKAAYRTGLGNSLYVAKHQLGKISTETLQHYVKSNFISGRGAVVGLGVNPSHLLHYAESLEIENKDSKTEPAKYKGGEIRSDKGGNFAFVAIAGEGSGICNTKESLAFNALKYALGAGPQCSWGVGAGPLSKSLGESARGTATAINISYADSGLFGVLIAAEADYAGAILKSAMQILKAGNVSDKDAARGKNLLKAAVLSELESGTNAVQLLGTHACVLGTTYSPKQIADAVDALTVTDINNAAKKLASGKLSIASVGNLKTVPFLDEIK